MPRPLDNPPNPWESTHVEWLEEPPNARLEVFEERARTILASNDSPDVPFRWSVNPYRGCYHACAYCYARPTHERLGFGAGTDFERKIVVKTNAPELLRRELAAPRWRGELIAFSGVTDCYQPLEAAYGLTRGCLEACLEAENPVGLITKGALVRRDADLLAKLARVAGVRVYVSLPFLDDDLGRRVEPGASRPSARLAAMAHLAAAGVPVGVSLSPVIPGLNDEAIPALLAAARAAGATHAFMSLLRLPGSTAAVFRERLQSIAPARAARVFSGLHDTRGGQPTQGRFGRRMQGEGPRWQALEDLFELHRRRLGFSTADDDPVARPHRPRRGQLQLFGK